MRKLHLFLGGLIWLATEAIGPAGLAWAQDTDHDGLPDSVEEILATDPLAPEILYPVGTFSRPPSEKSSMQFMKVEFGNVGQNRWLWAIHFQKPYAFSNAQLILYLDADNNPQTGRNDMGCEYMFSHVEGQPGVTAFAPDGSHTTAPLPRVALQNGVLYMCVDCPIKQENGRSVFRYMLLSEYRQPHVAADSTGWINANGPSNSEKRVILTVDQITSDENFLRTEGLDLIWKLQADPANICFRSPEAELRNMRYYDAEYRWWAVYGASGSITVTVPRAGTFIPAVVVYDTGGAETYQMLLEGKPLGHFVAAEDDQRQRIYFLKEPVTFRGGEKLTLKVGSVGQHITEDIMLLAKQPPVRGRKFEIQHIESGVARLKGKQVARLTWITTWPAACTVEYWPLSTAADISASKLSSRQPATRPPSSAPPFAPEILRYTEPAAVANHRVYLEGLQPGAVYGFRILAPKPDGAVVKSPDQKFVFRLLQPFAGTAKRERTPLRVENPYNFPLRQACIATGVPFSKGELGNPAHVRLLDPAGREIPVQIQPTAYWQDNSLKWLLVIFLADVPAKTTAIYQLEYGSSVKRHAFSSSLNLHQQGTQLLVNTGRLRVSFDTAQSALPIEIGFQEGERWRTAAQNPVAEIKDAAGHIFSTAHPPERIEMEESGPLRAVVKICGHHHNAEGKPFMAYIIRYVFYSGQIPFRVYYTWGNDVDSDFTSFKGLSMRFPLSVESASNLQWTTSVDGQIRRGLRTLSLRQMEDNQCTWQGDQSPAATGRRAEGWLDVSGAEAGLAIAVRDFWQLYPKAFVSKENALEVQLCPEFPAGTYDGRDMLEEIKLYYYLRNGEYKVRQGVQKQHELLIIPHSGGFSETLLQELTAFQEPLIAACTPERYCRTRVFGDVLPATAGRTPEYEQICENVYRGYVSYRENNRNYGMLNFGDVFGERKINWANGEYDHHHAFLMQFIRTGERKWLFLGEKAARHAIDVDTCHYGPRAGGVWIHSMGHTGGYYPRDPFGGLGIAGGGFTPSHTWTEGFCEWFWLTGDATAFENAALVADYYDGAYLNNYDFSNCRDNGWHILLTMAAYHATNDPYYLNAARIIVERTLERATPGDKPGELAGWHRQMVPGHCYDLPRHRGEANFMLGVLANALEVYYADVPDPRVAEAVKGGARQAVKELWVPEADGFRYTSCPNMAGYTANNDMTAEVLFFAYRLGGNPEWGEIAMRAMAAAFRDGIGSIAHLRWTPRIIYNMDLLRQEGLWLAPQPSVRVILRNEKVQDFHIWLAAAKAMEWNKKVALTTPNGKSLVPDETGKIFVEKGPPGYYVLTAHELAQPWRLETSLRYWCVDASAGVLVKAGRMPMYVRYFQGASATITPQKGQPSISQPESQGDIQHVVVRGPGQIFFKVSGPPWLSLGWGELMNPSAPLAFIEGPPMLRPGALSGEYVARVMDLDNDVEKYLWDIGAGKTLEGPRVYAVFQGSGQNQIKLRVRDKAGNEGQAEMTVKLPPAEFAHLSADDVIWIEAEDFADQGLDKVQIFERIGCSGRMISYWEATKGHWLEWRVPVSAAGDYVIYLRYCSGAPEAPHRALTINGQTPGPAFADMILPVTGGFCTQQDNWAYFAAGNGQPVRFAAGEHRLRLINLGGGVGLDAIMLVKK